MSRMALPLTMVIEPVQVATPPTTVKVGWVLPIACCRLWQATQVVNSKRAPEWK